MAEREEPQEGTEGTEDTEDTVPPHEQQAARAPEPPHEQQTARAPEPPQDGTRSGAPLDEDAAWAAIVAGYGAEPDVPGGWPGTESLPDGPAAPPAAVNTGIPAIPRAFVVRMPPVGPRDYVVPDDEDEGHFVPPDPPLPEADVTTKFAWLAVLGGPALLLAYVLTGADMPVWAMVVGVGGFLGGFVTLIARMRDPEDDDDDPHGGAVV